MNKEKASRNKTIDTPLSEGKEFLARCITITDSQPSLDVVTDKTILGNMFEVCTLLPEKSIEIR